MSDVPEDFRFLPDDEEGTVFRPGDAFSSPAEYRLERLLGSGGMGEVWQAQRLSAGGHRQDVAIKFLTLPDAEWEADLAEEALRISRLRHDNIVGFVDSGVTDAGAFFIAMEFVRGLDLDGLLDLHGLTPARVARGEGVWRTPCPMVGFILFMVGRALHHAHTRQFGSGNVGLVHRDISPGNVLIEEENGFVKLTDFGVAATVDAASGGDAGFTGKIPYAAPEVLYDEGMDHRADIYSLGLVAYELMTGLNPNRALTPVANHMAQLSHVLMSLEQRIVPPHDVVEGVDEVLSRIVLRMIDRDPDARYPTVDDLMLDLRTFLFSGGIGPTTGSFRDYIKLMKDPSSTVDSMMRSSLVFLCTDGEADPAVRQAWKLTPSASERLQAGQNPARVD
ncbi:MAG: serine/threonine protein kinase [Deltaproteobacteria bacterium]|nr:serine/threonine protein kinase [Deltaproteobacteria bacterium]